MKKGFTLIELLVVVLIIGILSAIALPQYTRAVEKARAAEALTLMGSMRYAAERVRLQNGTWPTSMSDLDISVSCPKFFTLSGSGTGDTYTIVASRAMVGQGTLTSTGGQSATIECMGMKYMESNPLGYSLKTEVTSSGQATRSCTPATNDICKAISGGHPNDF